MTVTTLRQCGQELFSAREKGGREGWRETDRHTERQIETDRQRHTDIQTDKWRQR